MRLLPPFLGLFAAAAFLAFARASSNGVEAGTALRMDVPELARRSDLIVEGRVLSQKPLETSHGLIETEFLIEVERTLAGEHVPLRAIRLPGGLLPDGRGLLLAGMPSMRVGESVLLFLTPRSQGGVRMPVGLAQGKLRVVANAAGEKLLVGDPGALGLVSAAGAEVGLAEGLSVLPYAEVVAQIEAARTGPAAGEKR